MNFPSFPHFLLVSLSYFPSFLLLPLCIPSVLSLFLLPSSHNFYFFSLLTAYFFLFSLLPSFLLIPPSPLPPSLFLSSFCTFLFFSSVFFFISLRLTSLDHSSLSSFLPAFFLNISFLLLFLPSIVHVSFLLFLYCLPWNCFYRLLWTNRR